MITRENIASHELIGLEAQITESNNRQLVGSTGKIVDESKYMFTLETGNGLKKYPKDHCHWKFRYASGDTVIDGTKLTKRSYERMGVKA